RLLSPCRLSRRLPRFPRPLLFFLTVRPPPTSTLFPYTTLFRSYYPCVPVHHQLPAETLVNRDLHAVRQSIPVAECAPEIELGQRSEEHTSELQSRFDLVCRLLLEKKKKKYPRRNRSRLTYRCMN